MDDMERYGDYNEIDEAPGGKKSPVALIFKILIITLCAGVVGILVFRMILSNYYPDSMKRIYFTDTLAAYYDATDGNIGAKTQKLRASYDDKDKGNFFCDYLVIVPGINQLQITLKYNVSCKDNIIEKYNLSDFDIEDPEALSFRLYDNYGRVYDNLVFMDTAQNMMYRYRKLVFDDVSFLGENGVAEEIGAEGSDDPAWIRLEVFVKGQTDKPFGVICIYENNTVYSKFTDYELSDKEVPGR